MPALLFLSKVSKGEESSDISQDVTPAQEKSMYLHSILQGF
jgi:hypothetical protein